MVFVAGAQDHRVNIAAATVFEIGGVAVYMGQQGDLGPGVGPGLAHGRGAMADGDRLCAILPALRPDVFGGVGRANN